MGGLSKVSVVGAGSVGTAIAYATLIQGHADEVALYDVNGPKARAEVLDLRHGLQFVPPARVHGGDDVEVCSGSDVVVITAGAKQDPGQSRMDLAAANVSMVRTLVPDLLRVSPDAVLLMVTNPVDVVTWAAHEASGLAGGRVIGSGTVLDTSRLRHLIARRLRVGLSNVHATVVGEHGDTSFALWSAADIGGAPITEVVGPDGARLDVAELDHLLDEVRGAAYRIIEGKGATNLAIGLATARILAAIGADERAVLPVTGRHDVDGEEVYLSLPSVVGAGGLLSTLSVPMSDDETAALSASAAAIRSVYRMVT